MVQGQQNEAEYPENNIRRGEQHQQYHQQPQQQNYQQYQQHQYQQPQQLPQDYQYQYPQQASIQQPQYAVYPSAQRRRRNSWQKMVGDFLGLNQNRRVNRRRGRRDVNDGGSLTDIKPRRASRQSKIAPIFQTPDKTIEVRGRDLGSPSIRTTNDEDLREITDKIAAVNNEIRLDEGPSPVRTLTKADLANIKSRIKEINKQLAKSNSNGTFPTTGRTGSQRQARFFNSLLNGWTSNSLLG